MVIDNFSSVKEMTFSQYCKHMYAENCHERREYGQTEYQSVEDYVQHGTNLDFLQKAYEDHEEIN